MDLVPAALYGDGARALQDTFDSRRLADRLAGVTVHDELTGAEVELISSQTTVMVATVDADGWPDVSYKGGVPGFVRVVDSATLEIPSYDGNGMYRTLGNVTDTGRVALLFIDVVQRKRLRVHGTAEVVTDPEVVAAHHGAEAVLRVRVGRAFPNCPRYLHPPGEVSEFAPRPGYGPPEPKWKSYPAFSDVLPRREPS